MKRFSQSDVELLKQQTVFQGFFKVIKYTFKHKLFAGGWSDPIEREVFERGDAVVVLPYDPVTDQVVLIEQIRFPALRTSESPWLFELVAGMIDKNRNAHEVAKAELMEEAGLDAKNITQIQSILASPGGTSERFYFYWAEVDATEAKGIYGLEQEHEDIKVHVMARERAFEMLEQGQIDNASTVIGLQWLQLNYHKIKPVI
ncbi:ADP-ribose diphosphatase [Shewanella sp. OPT22]|nr:ADP-ribose diphosphatase [Shewanella sp. OPT22]